MRDDNSARRDEPPEVPLAIQVISGVGGVVLAVGIVLLGVSRLDNGRWGTLGDLPAQVTILGVVIFGLLGFLAHEGFTPSQRLSFVKNL